MNGMWWASVLIDRCPEEEGSLNFIMSDWLDDIGDTRKELVFIGIERDEFKLRVWLNAPLLPGKEMAENPESWCHHPDHLNTGLIVK